MKKLTFWLFAALFFFVPLILWPFTSEVFEFNKMVLVYILTTLIVTVWITGCLVGKRFIYRRTILDIPLLVFIASQLISTLLSIDPRTSWLGYYSRFNGGFLSVLCYSLLYWAFVSNLDKNDVIKLINYSLLPGAFLVSAYAVAEHFGIDKSLWVQDVQSRVFSTLGQPNWLASWIIALTPLTWAFALKNGIKSKRSLIYFALSILFFWVLIFTKSRSGYLGFAVAFIVFWAYYLWSKRAQYKKAILPLLAVGVSIILICLISGTEYTPSLYSLFHHSIVQPVSQTAGPALETGGTESSTIRKIVWAGALQVWLHYPIFGTGVETFAYSYYLYRPAAHNLVSEWDFIYNKAHNEYLNFMANSGSIGIIAYLGLILFSILAFTIYQLPITNKMFNWKNDNSLKNENWELKIALLSGYSSLLATNFFGFSVVPTQLEFFLFPTMAISLANSQQPTTDSQLNKSTSSQKILILIVVSFMLYVVFAIGKYWYADVLYAKGKAYNGAGQSEAAAATLVKAINLEPGEPIYISELASAYVDISLAYNQAKDAQNSKKFADLAISTSDKAIALSPANLNLKRTRFGIFIMLSTIDQNYLIGARQTLLEAASQAPTDAKILYNLGLTYARTGQTEKALATLKQTVELKSNYKDARLAYAILLIDKKDYAEAKLQLNYILTNIDPNDSVTKQTLESIK